MVWQQRSHVLSDEKVMFWRKWSPYTNKPLSCCLHHDVCESVGTCVGVCESAFRVQLLSSGISVTVEWDLCWSLSTLSNNMCNRAQHCEVKHHNAFVQMHRNNLYMCTMRTALQCLSKEKKKKKKKIPSGIQLTATDIWLYWDHLLP